MNFRIRVQSHQVKSEATGTIEGEGERARDTDNDDYYDSSAELKRKACGD